jgi:hypothetical protein
VPMTFGEHVVAIVVRMPPLRREDFRWTELPLNLDKNNRHSFHPTLTTIRAEARERAHALPNLPNPGVGGARID